MHRFFALSLVALLLAPAALQAQNREATEQRLQELREQIAAYEERMSEVRERTEASEQSLQEVEREIAVRTELINNFQRRMNQLTQESAQMRASMRGLEEEVQTVQQQYQGRATHAYKYGRLHDLALILSAESINQMLIRIQYLTRFTQQRREKLADVEAATAELREQRAELQVARERTQELLAEAERERRNLSRLEEERRSIVATLRNEQEDIEEQLDADRSREQALVQELRRIAEAGAERGRERAAASARSAAEFEALSGSFLENRGQLPWPSPGVVTEAFGEVVNPVHGTRTPNPGILIATREQEEVRAVFDGQVETVDIIPNFGRFVVVSHGQFQTLYSNFSLLYVGPGDRIDAGQVIGRAGTEAEPRGASVFFAIFDDGEEVNPTRWLGPR